VRFYRDAPALDPNDTVALARQGEAMVQKGAVERARVNLARINQLCKGACPPAAALNAAIARALRSKSPSPSPTPRFRPRARKTRRKSSNKPEQPAV
jgi:hypothetical protein